MNVKQQKGSKLIKYGAVGGLLFVCGVMSQQAFAPRDLVRDPIDPILPG